MLNTLVNKLSIHNVLQSALFVPSVVKSPLKAHVVAIFLHMGKTNNPCKYMNPIIHRMSHA